MFEHLYNQLKGVVLDLLRCPSEPPEPPTGSHDSVQVFRAAPAYLRYRILMMWVGLVPVLLAETVVALVLLVSQPVLGLLAALAILVFAVGKTVFFYVVTRLDYEMRYYLITDRSLRIRDGVIEVREVTLTFENIQNMRIEQGPVQRMFGLYDLVVDTAGRGASPNPEDPAHGSALNQAVFRGIGRPAELRDLIMTYLRQIGTSGLGDHDDRGHVAGSGAASVPGAMPLLSQESLAVLRAIRTEVAAWRREVEKA
jgi:membrane protein YdbS with pleckstrin-like domain